jgi:hypothetical protein
LTVAHLQAHQPEFNPQPQEKEIALLVQVVYDFALCVIDLSCDY